MPEGTGKCDQHDLHLPRRSQAKDIIKCCSCTRCLQPMRLVLHLPKMSLTLFLACTAEAAHLISLP